MGRRGRRDAACSSSSTSSASAVDRAPGLHRRRRHAGRARSPRATARRGWRRAPASDDEYTVVLTTDADRRRPRDDPAEGDRRRSTAHAAQRRAGRRQHRRRRRGRQPPTARSRCASPPRNWDAAQTVTRHRRSTTPTSTAPTSRRSPTAPSASTRSRARSTSSAANPDPDLPTTTIPPAVMLPGESSGDAAHCRPRPTSLDGSRATRSTRSTSSTATRLRRHRHAHLDAPDRARHGRATSSSAAARPGRHHLRGPRGAQHPPRSRRRPLPHRRRTHTGTTRVTGSDGDDVIDVRTIVGPTFIEGDAGNDDPSARVGPQAGTIDSSTRCWRSTAAPATTP